MEAPGSEQEQTHMPLAVKDLDQVARGRRGARPREAEMGDEEAEEEGALRRV